MKEYLNRKEVMELFGISRSTLIRMERRGDLKPIHITPKIVVYSRKDIEQLLKRKAQGRE